MSVMLPYCETHEINKYSTTCKKAYVQGKYWPVWKNIYEDHFKDTTETDAMRIAK